MKRVFLLGAIAALGLSACKKDYTCKCKGDGYEYETTILESKRSAAKTLCEGKGIGKIGDEDGENAEELEKDCELSKFD